MDLLKRFSDFLEEKPSKTQDVCTKCSRALSGHKFIWCRCGGKFQMIRFKKWIDFCRYRLDRTSIKDRKRLMSDLYGDHGTTSTMLWRFKERLNKEEYKLWIEQCLDYSARDIILDKCGML